MHRHFLLLIISFVVMALPLSAQAQKPINLEVTDFPKLSVLHEGRIKPLSSFSKLLLKRFSGLESLNNLTSIDWLAVSIFDPKTAATLPVFHITNDQTKDMLSLTGDKEYYSMIELSSPLAESHDQMINLLKSPVENLNPDQLAFLKLYDDVMTYRDLMRSLSLVLPLNVSIPDQYQDIKNPTYLDLQRYASEIAIEAKNNGNTAFETLNSQMTLIGQGGQDNAVFKIIPPQWQSSKEASWHTPWEVILNGYGSPETSQFLAYWKNMANSYRSSDQQSFVQSSEKAFDFIAAETDFANNLFLENIYVMLDPFFWAEMGYGLSIFFLILWFMTHKRMFWRPAILTTLGAILLHKTGILLRILILERPPISTLHETILFISFIAVLFPFIQEFKRKDGVSVMLSCIAGASLLLLSSYFIDAGDTKAVLSAVLNSNFWLGTHVVVISIGYGLCLITALYAHYLLIQGGTDKALSKTLMIVTLLSLFFMSAGTLLGAVWADQSWGRFWGWDPKENGALLVVLWLVWVIHGRLSGQIIGHNFIAGLAFTNVFLALSWFGVNLLGVGLHSYGFTQGLTSGLVGFCLAETIFILYFLLKNKKKST